MKSLKQIFALVIFLSTFLYAESKNELLFYVGITMVKPVNELAKIQDMLEVGAYNHLILNGTVVGDFPFIILSASQYMNFLMEH